MYIYICTTHNHVLVKVEINYLLTYFIIGLQYMISKQQRMASDMEILAHD